MITIDSRESTAVQKAFKKHGIECKVEVLPVGDFICNEKPNVTVEHKTISDFVGSFRKKHIQKQLIQAQQNFEYSYLIINGSWKDYMAFGHGKVTIKQRIGMLVSIATRYNIRIISVDNNSQLALTVKTIFEKADDGKVVTIKDTELLRNTMTTDDLKIKILTGFDGVGLKNAEKLLKDDTVTEHLDHLVRAVQKEKK